MNATEQHKAVYVYMGQRIRERRKLLNLSQSELADMMGFSYQQMQKYETGASQVSAGKLLLFAKILNVPASYFYEGINLEEAIGKRLDSHIIPKTRTEPLRILLVDHNPADVILFKKVLSSCSEQAQVNIMHDADDVMDFLQNHETKFGQRLPDIIVLDISMPKLSGIELLKMIKKRSRMMEIPVIVLTNSISMKDMIESYREGAAGFIQKSVEFEEYKESLDVMVKYWSKTVALPCV